MYSGAMASHHRHSGDREKGPAPLITACKFEVQGVLVIDYLLFGMPAGGETTCRESWCR